MNTKRDGAPARVPRRWPATLLPSILLPSILLPWACLATLSPAAALDAPPPDKPLCDADCIRANMERAVPACAAQIEAQAPLDFDWLHRPVPGIFSQAEQPAPTDPVVRYRGDGIRFQSPRKDWERMAYECAYDVKARRVVAVSLHPGRLAARLEPVETSVILPWSTPPAGQARRMPAAAAPQGAVAQGGPPPAAPRRPAPRVGEPSPIEIEQQSPRVRP